MLLTLAATRNALFSYGSDAVLSGATTQQKADFAARLNAAAEELFNLSDFRNAERRINVPAYDNMITLPRYAATALGMHRFGCHCSEPLLVYSKFHEFLPGSAARSAQWGTAEPVTTTAQTFRNPPTSPFKLRTIGGEAGGNITLIGGRDSSYDEYDTSVTLAIINGTTTSSRTWTSIPQIQLPSGRALNVSLYAVDATTGTATQIAIYAPSETVPAYPRYAAPDFCDEEIVTCLIRLAFVPVVADTDIVFPGNLAALRHMLSAMNREDKLDLANSDALTQKAVRQLNSELQFLEGSEFRPITFLADFGAGSIPQPV